MPNNIKKPFQPKIDPNYTPNAPKEVLDKSITALNIYPETQTKLEAVGIKTIFDVAILEMKYLYRINNMSKKDVFAVMRGLHSAGLDFKKSDKPPVEDNSSAPARPAQPKPRPQDNRADKPNAPKINNNPNANNPNRGNNPNVARANGNPQPSGNRNNNPNDNRNKPNINNNGGNQPKRERLNTREDFNDNGTIKADRERINSRDFNRNSNSNKRNQPLDSPSFISKQQTIKKTPIKLPPLIIEDGLYKFFKLGKWGYKDDKGVTIIEPQFDEAYNFSEGMAGVEMHERVGFINKVGELVIPATFDTACSFTEGLASVTVGNSSWYIDKEGNKQFEMEFESATPFKNGSALVKKEGKWNFISKDSGELRPR